MNRTLLMLLAALLVTRILAAAVLWPAARASHPEWAWENNDGYDRIAASWLATGVYGETPGTPSAVRLPAYPALLALARLPAQGRLAIPLAVALQVLLSVATGWFLYRTARLFLSETAAALALALFILHPQANNFVFRCATETLFCFLVAGLVFHAARHLRDGAPRDLYAAAAFLGASLLTRPTLFLFPLLLLPPLAWNAARRPKRRAWAHLAGAALLALAMLTPWIARNAALGAGFPTLETWRGRSLYHGVWVSQHLDRFFAGRHSVTDLDAAAGRRYVRELHDARASAPPDSAPPLAYERWACDLGARLGREELAASWPRTFALTARNALLAPFLQMTWRSTLVLAAYHGPLLALAFAGLWLAWRRDRIPALAAFPIVAALLYFWLLHAAVWPQARYVLPGLLPFSIFAGRAFEAIFATIPGRRTP